MRVSCPSCNTTYNFDESRVARKSSKLKCARCQALFSVELPDSSPGTEPAPSGPSFMASTASSPAVPLPAAPPPDQGERPPPPGSAEAPIPLPGFGPSEDSTAQNELPPGFLAGAGAPNRKDTLDDLFSDLEDSDPAPVSPEGDRSAFGLTGFNFDEESAAPPQAAPAAPEWDVHSPNATSPGGAPDAFPPRESDFSSESAGSSFEEFVAPASSAPDVPAFADFPAQSTSELAKDFLAPLPGAELEDLPAPSPAPTVAEGRALQPFGRPPGDGGLELPDFDLSGPLPDFSNELSSVPTPPDDGLFAPGTAEAPATPENVFSVRNPEGMNLGSFSAPELRRLLDEGKLRGDEEISSDEITWQPVTHLNLSGSMLQTLSDSARNLGAEDELELWEPEISYTPAAGGQPGSVDRLKRLYEGRNAAVAVAGTVSPRARFRALLPLLVAGSAALVFLGTGIVTGLTTHYGYFGLNYLFPAKVKKGSPEATELERARSALLADTFLSYQEAKNAAGAVLSVEAYPEARALWSQAVFYLHRRYSAAPPDDLQVARDQMKNVALLGDDHPEVVKARVGQWLSENNPQEALNHLNAHPTARDTESAILRAEAYELLGNLPPAMETLQKVLEKDSDSSKALHALGNLFQRQRKPEKAAEMYSLALNSDKNHIRSAVELGAVELFLRNDVDQGLKAVEQALGEDARRHLAPSELARAYTVKGEALALRQKYREALAQLELGLKHDAQSIAVRAGLGKVHLALLEYEPARVHFKVAYDNEPRTLDNTAGYLTALIELGKMAEAVQVVDAANGHFPGNSRIAFLHGRIADALEKTQEAERHYLRSLNGDPRQTEAAVFLTRMYLRYQRVADARDALKNASSSEDPFLLIAYGELALFENDLSEAGLSFDRALRKNPNLPSSYVGQSKVALLRGDIALAERSIEKALSIDPSVKDGHLQKGLLLWKKGQLEQALSELELARSLDPKSAQVMVELGALLFEKGQYAAAETALSTGLSLNNADPFAYFHLARVQSRREQHLTAIENIKRAVELAPRKAEFHYELGLILRDGGKVTEALDAWKTTVTLLPKHADAMEQLGRSYLDRGEIETAISYFTQALRVSPRRFRLQAFLGDCHFAAGQWSDAIRYYLRALKLDPSLTGLPYKLARAHTEMGRHGQAIDWYKKATVSDANNVMSWFYLGYAYKEKGRRQDAIGAFAMYLKKSPSAEERKMIEDEIYDLRNER